MGEDRTLAVRLAEYVGDASNTTFLDECLTEAGALIGEYVRDAAVPGTARDRAVLEVASELYHRRNSPQGVAQFPTIDGQAPVRVARDPMVRAYPILHPWMGAPVG